MCLRRAGGLGSFRIGARLKGRAGFTMIELAMVSALFIVLLSMAVPRVNRAMGHTRVNNAASLVAADLRQGFELAARMRAPVRVAYTSATSTYAISNRATGVVIRSRALGSTSEYRISQITFSPTQVDIFPSGISSQTLTVTLSSGDYSRQVLATTAGFVRKSQ